MANYADQQIAAALVAGNPGRAKLWMRIKAEVDKAPPLGMAQRDVLSVLLRPSLPATLPPRPAPPTLPDRMPPRPAPVKRRPAARSHADDEAAAPAPTRAAA